MWTCNWIKFTYWFGIDITVWWHDWLVSPACYITKGSIGLRTKLIYSWCYFGINKYELPVEWDKILLVGFLVMHYMKETCWLFFFFPLTNHENLCHTSKWNVDASDFPAYCHYLDFTISAVTWSTLLNIPGRQISPFVLLEIGKLLERWWLLLMIKQVQDRSFDSAGFSKNGMQNVNPQSWISESSPFNPSTATECHHL